MFFSDFLCSGIFQGYFRGFFIVCDFFGDFWTFSGIFQGFVYIISVGIFGAFRQNFGVFFDKTEWQPCMIVIVATFGICPYFGDFWTLRGGDIPGDVPEQNGDFRGYL